MAGVFISYAREDISFGQRLHDALSSSGREPAWDQDHVTVPFSAPWRQAIRTAINNSDKFIFVISPSSLASQPCADELAHALEVNKQIIPILRQPPRAGQAVPRAVEELNWISFREDADFDSSFGQLTSALDTDLVWVKSHTRLLTRSSEWSSAQRDRSQLLRGSELRAAEAWLADADGHTLTPPTALQREYIIVSRRASDRSARLWRGALAAGLVVALVLAGIAFLQRDQALQERGRAIRAARVAASGQLAAESESLLASNAVTASRLAAAAWRMAPTAQARDSMLDVLAQPVRYVLTDLNAQNVAFSPDGRILATADGDNTARLWNVATHRQIGSPLIAGAGVDNRSLSALAFSPDGKTVATADGDGTVRLWGMATHRQTGSTLPGTFAANVITMAFSPDGRILATGDGDGLVRLWDLATHRQLGSVSASATIMLLRVAFNPGGKTFTTTDVNTTTRVWDTATLRQIGGPFITDHTFGQNVALSADGRIVATGDSAGTVRLWDVATHQQIGSAMSGTGSTVRVAGFSPDGRMLAVADEDGTAKLWNITSQQQIGAPLTSNASMNALAISHGGKSLATVDSTGPVWLWDLTAHRQIGAFRATDYRIRSAAFSPDGTILVVIGSGGRTLLWNVTTQRQLGSLPAHRYTVSTAALSPDRKVLAIGDSRGKVRLWNVATHHQIGTPLTVDSYRDVVVNGYSVDSIAFSADGRTVVAAAGGTVRRWNMATHRQIGKSFTTHMRASEETLTSNGETLAQINGNGDARLWDLMTHRNTDIIGAANVRNSYSVITISPNGKFLAADSIDGTVRLWDISAGRQIESPLTDHSGEINTMAFSPDGSTLATESTDQTVRLWDVATGHQIGSPFTAGVMAMAFSPDGKILAGVDSTGEVRLWDVAQPNDMLKAVCTIAGHSLTRSEWHTYIPSQPFQQVCAIRAARSSRSAGHFAPSPRPTYTAAVGRSPTKDSAPTQQPKATATATHVPNKKAAGSPSVPCWVWNGVPYPSPLSTVPSQHQTTCTIRIHQPSVAADGAYVVLTDPAGQSAAYALVSRGF